MQRGGSTQEGKAEAGGTPVLGDRDPTCVMIAFSKKFVYANGRILVKSRETVILTVGIVYRIINKNTWSFCVFISRPKGNDKMSIFNP